MVKVPSSKDKFSGRIPNVNWKSINPEWKKDCFRIRQDIEEYHEQGSKEWLDSRERCVCASDLGNLFGFWSRYGSALYGKLTGAKVSTISAQRDINMKLCYNKVCYAFKRLYNDGEIAEVPEHIMNCEPCKNESNAAMQWGKIHETNALKVVHDETDFVIAESGLKKSKHEIVVGDTKLPLYIGASPDGLINTDIIDGVGENAVLEIKCSTPFIPEKDAYKYFKRMKWKTFPHYYVSQVQLQMYQTKRMHAYLVNYTPTDGVKIMKMKFNARYMELVIDMIKTFAIYAWSNSKPPREDFWSTYENYEEYLRLNDEIVKSIEDYRDVPSIVVERYLKPFYIRNGDHDEDLFLDHLEPEKKNTIREIVLVS